MTAAPFPPNVLTSTLSSSEEQQDMVNPAESSPMKEVEAANCEVSKDSSGSPATEDLTGSSETDVIDAAFVLPRCTGPPRNVLEPIETFVAKAVDEQHKEGNDHFPLQNYKGIVDAIRMKNDRSMLFRLLIALRTSGSGSTLHLLTSKSSRHARLIHQIVRMNPFELPPPPPASSSDTGTPNDSTSCYDIADAHLHLLMAIVSANSVFLIQTMTAVWKLLTHQVEEIPEERSQRLHAALATILRLCPKGKTELFPIMSSNCPFRMRPGPELEWYYRQCLEVLRYLPAIQPLVLELIVDKCLEIDVEIKINDGGEVLFDDDKEDGIFQLDLDKEDQAKQPLPTGISVDEMADKLDSLMSLLFQYTETTTAGVVPHSSLYQVFIRVFESSIVITHKSKCVQFILFHICGLENKELGTLPDLNRQQADMLYRDFATRLIEIIVDPFRSTVTRQAGACYLASFVSRSLFVCDETVCESISALLRWAQAYIDSLESVLVQASDPQEMCRLHSLFYTVCQSAFYIMCFRGVDAMSFYQNSEASVEHIELSDALWNTVCGHALQPLKFCLETVRKEFVQIAKFCQLLDANLLDLLERDGAGSSCQHRERKRSRVMTAAMLEKERLSGGVGGLGRGTNPLDSFFPFDPYLLLRSQAYVEPFYRHWPGSVEDVFVAGDGDNHAIEEDVDNASTESSDSNVSSEDSSHAGRSGDLVHKIDSESVASPPVNFVTAIDTTPDVLTKRAQLREVWTENLKRSRAPSMENENGSW